MMILMIAQASRSPNHELIPKKTRFETSAFLHKVKIELPPNGRDKTNRDLQLAGARCPKQSTT